MSRELGATWKQGMNTPQRRWPGEGGFEVALRRGAAVPPGQAQARQRHEGASGRPGGVGLERLRGKHRPRARRDGVLRGGSSERAESRLKRRLASINAGDCSRARRVGSAHRRQPLHVRPAERGIKSEPISEGASSFDDGLLAIDEGVRGGCDAWGLSDR